MKVEIDQSGKIGEAGVSTVLAFSNGKQKTLILQSATKSTLIKNLKSIKNREAFYFRLFAYLLFRLLEKDLSRLTQIHIDDEYHGRFGEIKGYFLHILLIHNITIDPTSIHVCHIGKKSRAHIAALATYRAKTADITIIVKEVMKFFVPQKRDRGSYRK